jgi:hypothetical protein
MGFSWGGFARTLNENITKDRDAEREEATYARRKRMEMELEKEFGAEIIARTAIEGNTEVGYNRYGDRIRTRTLTAEELAQRTAELNKIKADARAAEAGAGVAERNLDTYDERWSLDKEQTRAQIDSSRASAYASRVNAETNRAQLELARSAHGGLPKEVSQELNEVITMIQRLPINGINSPERQTEALLLLRMLLRQHVSSLW